MVVANTLAYNDTATIGAVKILYYRPWVGVHKTSYDHLKMKKGGTLTVTTTNLYRYDLS